MNEHPAARVSVSRDEYRALVADQMPERALLERVRQLARETGWLVYHTHDSRRSEPGFPDLVLLHPGRGRLLVRELKAAKGRVSPAQRAWLDGLSAAGVDAGVWRPVDWLDRTIEYALDPAAASAWRPS